MEKSMFKISKEELEKFSVEELVDLKIELEELEIRLNSVLSICDEALKA